MVILSEMHPGWIRAITGRQTHIYEFLGTKILMGRLTLMYQKNPSPETTRRSVAELMAFFEKNKNVPAAQRDLNKILGEG